jgi:hypothetical protein
MINYDHTVESFRIWAAGTERMRISGSGNVGIGTTSPQKPLEVWDNNPDGMGYPLRLVNNEGGSVYDGSGVGIYFSLSGNGQGAIGFDSDDTASDSARFFINTRLDGSHGTFLNNEGKFVVDPAGNVGIGTKDPTALLDVEGAGNTEAHFMSGTSTGNFDMRFGDTANRWALAYNGTSKALTFYENSAGAHTMALSGSNVGIANTDPGSYLTIGDTSATSTTGIHIKIDANSGGQSAQYTYVYGTSYSGKIHQLHNNRNPHSGNYNFYSTRNPDDVIFTVKGDGTVTGDQSYSTPGADYAEYFEVAKQYVSSSFPDGMSVSFSGSYIVPAVSSSLEPIGVIRPEDAASVVGGTYEFQWQGKWLKTEYGRHILDENNDRVLNPEWSSSLSASYASRASRQEWQVVSLLGQVPITKGQPTGSSWIKMKDISETVEMWLVK